ncbi:hypothetical protein AJ79_05126 [Helicocarpus griseus UAMH5409]|uniref:Carrier domain-containing protein n=1 Tax=Helicocarpus griseus UAMH5409 TaxID=1447875 RepID=A0A2B7XPU1_9EURO|nr:hypothetical protein AJ79_05126 [Helicocarpus griseus UAMH5409]
MSSFLAAEIHGPKLTYLSKIKTVLNQTIQRNPNTEALVSLHQSSQSLNLSGPDYLSPNPPTGQQQQQRLSWTYQQLCNNAETLSARLTALGLKKGSSITVISNACAEWALFFWAAVLFLDCPFSPIDPRIVTRGNDTLQMLGDIGPSVVVVMDWETAGRLEKVAQPELRTAGIKVVLGNSLGERGVSQRIPGWISLLELWKGSGDIETSSNKEAVPGKAFDDTVIISFTSGTTSFQKACPQSSDNLMAPMLAFQKMRNLSPTDRLVQHQPPFAAMAVFMSLTFWVSGATIVYPSARFNITTSIDAIESERCTYMIAVPTMIKALAMQQSTKKKDLSSLRIIEVSGAMTYPEIINLCLSSRKLQCKAVGCGWGMTEAPAALFSGLYEKEIDETEKSISVGRPIPGSIVRICALDSRKPLRRGEEGELHVGGVTVIRGYLNGELANDVFYSDDGIRWIATGDMAKIDDSGAVHILGRYKDIIVRGGHNIAPARIERCLDRIVGVESQVVGVADEYAGDIPIAVVKLSGLAAETPKETFKTLQALALEELGTAYAPQMFLDLKADLQREDFPSTLSGKLRKGELAGIVKEFVKQRYQKIPQLSKSTEDTLASIWSEVSGLNSDSIDRKVSIFRYVDSITTMRFSSAVRKKLQKTLSVDDVIRHPSIEDQAKILNSRSALSSEVIQQRMGPPTVEDMVHCAGQTSKAERTQQLATPLLQRLGLTWDEDVEDVFPAPDTSHIYLQRRRPQTWNQRSIFIAHNVSHDRLVEAWKATTQRHAMFRTIVVGYNDGETPIPQDGHGFHNSHQLFIVIRANDRLWNCSLRAGFEVNDPEELWSTFLNEWGDSTTGPLIRVAFAHIRNNNISAFILVGNHAAYDNLSVDRLLEDLSTALDHNLTAEDMLQAPGHTPFKRFADLYHIHRTSPSALEAVAFHVNRLRGIGKSRSSLWPPQRAPGFFKGTDVGWTMEDGSPGDPGRRIPLDDDPSNRHGLDGLTHTAPARHLAEMRKEYGVLPHVILKAAVALFNTSRTSSHTALFANLEASRTWPFVGDWTTAESREELPNPLDIAGPMFQVVLNRIDVPNRAETAIGFLRRVQEEQALLSRYSQAPLFEIQRSLGQDDAEMMCQAMTRQGYNWAPGIQSAAFEREAVNKPKTIVKFQRQAYDDICLAWTCGLWDADTFYVNASYDDCQISKAEALQAMQEVLCAGVWLADPQNANRTIDECVFERLELGKLIKSLE